MTLSEMLALRDATRSKLIEIAVTLGGEGFACHQMTNDALRLSIIFATIRRDEVEATAR